MTSAVLPFGMPPAAGWGRNSAVLVGVLALHLVAIWALQAGLRWRAPEILVPVEVISATIELPRPPAVATLAPPKPVVVDKPVVAKPPTPARVPIPTTAPTPAPVAPPMPLAPAVVTPEPSPNAPTAAASISPPAELPAARSAVTDAGGAASSTGTGGPSGPSKVDLPSSDAAYLNNPVPLYPRMSDRLKEEGTVVMRVLVGADGTVKQIDVKQTSGFERLDRAAMSAMKTWRFVPGKRNGVAEAMWMDAPIHWKHK